MVFAGAFRVGSVATAVVVVEISTLAPYLSVVDTQMLLILAAVSVTDASVTNVRQYE